MNNILKRMWAVLVAGLFLCGFLQAQSSETITNNAVIKMVKANLADELIIDVIRTSPVDFDLSEKAVKSLVGERVSGEVLEAMMIAGQTQTPGTQRVDPPSETTKPPKPETTVKPAIPAKRARTPQVVTALGYTAPLKLLVTFYEDEFKSMQSKVVDWDAKVRNSLLEAGRLNEEILQQEAALREKKNSDAKAFSKDILAMKKKLSELRANYKQLKEKMTADADKITKELSGISSDKAKAVSKSYDEVGQQVRSSDSHPGKGENAVPVTFAPLDIQDDLTVYLEPAAEMFYWHQNEMNDIRRIIEEWNPKISEIVKQDATLLKELEPIEKQLGEYKADPKKYKTEIATLKKQSAAIEKERKQLADQMENDSKELAGYLKETSANIQKALEERFADIIENINYTYREKLHI